MSCFIFLQCGVRCWFEKLGFINSDGQITPNELMLKIALDESNFFEKIIPCVGITSETRCERAFKVLGCLWNKLVKEKSWWENFLFFFLYGIAFDEHFKIIFCFSIYRFSQSSPFSLRCRYELNKTFLNV